MNATHPLSRLTSAEASLISAIDAATARLEAVGTTSLDAALERFRIVAHAASTRLSNAGAVVASMTADVLEHILGEALGITRAMGREPEPATTAPAQPFPGYFHIPRPADADILHDLPAPEVLARLPFLFAGQRPPEPEEPEGPTPAPRRTGLPIVDALLDIAHEAEVEATAPTFAHHEPASPREKYPAAPAFSPDGPTLFDAAGNATEDPTLVLLGEKAVQYVPEGGQVRPGTNGDSGAGHTAKTPQRKRKGR